MPRKKRPQFDKSKAILVGVIAGLTGIMVTLIVAQSAASHDAASDYSGGQRVSLGPMSYRIVDEKAVRRADETAKSLKAFLLSLTEKDGQQDCDSYYNVVLTSSDEKQVLLEYGCPYPNARMFAVRDGSEWRTISPTNHFDIFGVPECSYVGDNQIAKELAPICVNWADETSGATSYTVR
jgi:hypothetical protein